MSILLRVLIAVIAVVLAIALAPLVMVAIGFPLAANMFSIFKLVCAGIAVFYIIRGGPIVINR